MEKYRKDLIQCAIKTGMLCVLLIVTFLLFTSPLLAGILPSLPANAKDDVFYMRLGAVSGFLLVSILFIVRNITAIHKPEKLQQMYVQKNDERDNMIKQKTGSSTMIITAYVLLFAIMVAGSFSMVICKTLIAVLYVIIFIYIGTNWYYRRKY